MAIVQYLVVKLALSRKWDFSLQMTFPAHNSAMKLPKSWIFGSRKFSGHRSEGNLWFLSQVQHFKLIEDVWYQKAPTVKQYQTVNIKLAHWHSTDPRRPAPHRKTRQHADFSATKLQSDGPIHHLWTRVNCLSALRCFVPAQHRTTAVGCCLPPDFCFSQAGPQRWMFSPFTAALCTL